MGRGGLGLIIKRRSGEELVGGVIAGIESWDDIFIFATSQYLFIN